MAARLERSEIEPGHAALEAGDFAKAARVAEAALRRAPADCEALVLAGCVAAGGMYLGVALDYFERAVLADPCSAAGYAELGRAYARGGAFGVAREILQLALTRVEEHAGAFLRLAQAYDEFDAREAASLYRRALGLDPQLREAQFGLVSALARLGELDEARRIAQAPASGAHALNLQALVADAEGDDDALRALLERGAREHATDPSFLYNLYATKLRRGQLDAAERDVDALLQRFPGNARAVFAKSTFLLRRGEFTRGFEAFEARRRMPELARSARHAPLLQWDGGDLEGKRILVLDELGLGDSMMFARFLPRLTERGAEVRYICREPLYSLYAGQRAFTEIDVVPHGSGRATHHACDCYATAFSLPYLLRLSDPGRSPYLAPPADLADEWAARLAGPSGGALRVGLVWTANLHSPVGSERSMPLEALSPLLRSTDASFFSLQLGGGEALKAFPQVTDLTPGIRDFADSAGIIAHLDVLVTVDTSPAHLAGALGKPVLVMAQADVDWRWGADAAGRSYWYETARVVRQRKAGDWAGVVEEVAAGIKKKRRP